MHSIQEIKNRIRTVKSTRQITKAMKMVSASKLRKSQDLLLKIRPYAFGIVKVFNRLKDSSSGLDHPLFVKREIKKTKILLISSDRGLCGSYNSNVIKTSEAYYREAGLNEDNSVFDFVGRKAYDYFRHRYKNIGDNYRTEAYPSYETASYIVERLTESYIEGDFDALVIIYNEFKSAISSRVMVERLFPISTPDNIVDEENNFCIYEPSKLEIINNLVPKYVRIEIFRVLLEAVASEHSVRMSAMDSATRNSEDMIKSLSLSYNRARQDRITKELMEIVGGKEALENS
jgi:F-type H+-transporting ATPase subunit gamma